MTSLTSDEHFFKPIVYKQEWRWVKGVYGYYTFFNGRFKCLNCGVEVYNNFYGSTEKECKASV